MAEKSVTESADGLDTVDKHSLSLADSQTRVQSAKGKRPLARFVSLYSGFVMEAHSLANLYCHIWLQETYQTQF